MKLNGARIKELREGKPYRSQAEIAMAMRNFGHKGTLPSWVSQAERGLIDADEATATCLAAALGVGLSEIMRPEDATRLLLLRLEDKLADFGHELARVRAGLNDPLRAIR